MIHDPGLALESLGVGALAQLHEIVRHNTDDSVDIHNELAAVLDRSRPASSCSNREGQTP